jgi:hypothetical protein
MEQPTFRVYRLEFLIPERMGKVAPSEHTEALILLEKLSTRWINWQNKKRGYGRVRMPAYLDSQT